jgi:hypothetical protein
MGYEQILATVKDNPDKFLLFYVGGENGYTAEDNYNALNKLTVNDALDLESLKSRLKEESWVTIEYVQQYEGVEVHSLKEHYPSEENM